MTKFLNISVDNTLGGASPSDEVVSSQKAIKGYVDTGLSGKQATLTAGTGISISSGTISVTSPTLINNADSSGTGVAVKGSGTVQSTQMGVYGSASSMSSAYGFSSTATGSQSISIGHGSQATQAHSYALGEQAKSTANGAFQFGYGTNNEAGTVYFGLNTGTENSTTVNYKLLGSDGIIPSDRISVMTGADGTNAGTKGLVPAPTASDNTKYLKGNGNFSQIAYSEISGTPTIPTVNNATLTITQGGTTKGTFTANASSDVTIALDAGGGGGLPPQTGNAGKFLTTDGTDESWGRVKTNNLFDNKWCDYELNDQNWLRADTFSWQDGTVYSEAYSHLVADYNGGTSKTETVGSYTISYVEATDGHKITTDGTTVANIYSESGIAWYYVLDTTNQKFKLPRTKWGFVGVRDSVGKYVEESLPALPLHPTQTEASGYGLAGSAYFVNRVLVDNAYSPSNYVGNSTIYQNNAKVQQQSTQMYLYFYVGQFSQSATEQTAGITTAQLNAKLDLDLGNATNTSKEAIVNFGMPDYTAGVSKTVGTNYTADKNGFLKIEIINSSWGSLVIDGVTVVGTLANNANLCALSFVFPIAKGQVYNVSGVASVVFYPAIGG